MERCEAPRNPGGGSPGFRFAPSGLRLLWHQSSFERALQSLSTHARYGFFTLEIAQDENFDAGGGCEAIFAPVEKSAGGAALGGGHGRYMAILRRDRHSGPARLRRFGLVPPQ